MVLVYKIIYRLLLFYLPTCTAPDISMRCLNCSSDVGWSLGLFMLLINKKKKITVGEKMPEAIFLFSWMTNGLRLLVIASVITQFNSRPKKTKTCWH